MQKSVHKILIV